MSLTATVRRWKKGWTQNRNKHDLGPSEQHDWDEYLNSLSNAEFLFNLEIYEDLS